ncbi:hypothetical protein [Trinickia violacea]|uniref:hypothetical protein n=1 Tax=Trinickia violacea TaxID=2571746 RepID=UPI00346510B7
MNRADVRIAFQDGPVVFVREHVDFRMGPMLLEGAHERRRAGHIAKEVNSNDQDSFHDSKP